MNTNTEKTVTVTKNGTRHFVVKVDGKTVAEVASYRAATTVVASLSGAKR